ncbi:MAG: hypothetical protein ACLP8S_34470 [Solirubrobacteraceae bacterium]
MSDVERIELLEHRVRDLQTAVVAIVQHLGIEQRVASVERARLDEIRLSDEPEGPRERLIALYSTQRP